jgi:hypothetical protein
VAGGALPARGGRSWARQSVSEIYGLVASALGIPAQRLRAPVGSTPASSCVGVRGRRTRATLLTDVRSVNVGGNGNGVISMDVMGVTGVGDSLSAINGDAWNTAGRASLTRRPQCTTCSRRRP